jgi:RNA polymerase sigma-70 factor (ECF subfamily)
VRRAATGEERAFGLLVERYKAMVYSLSYRLLTDRGRAEDAAQETFIKAWAALPGFRGQAKFSTWLYRICYNTCISELRRKCPEVALDEATGVGEAGPAAECRRREVQRVIDEEIRGLPEVYRAILTLRHFAGQSYEEIARTTGRPMGTVKAMLHRARAALKARLVVRLGRQKLDEVMWR